MENISAEASREYIETEIFGTSALDLSDRQLSKVPEAVTDLKDLAKLKLDRNNLTELPRSINKLKNLKWLYLEENQLTYLPDSIGDLKELWMLTVSKNQLSAVPTCVQHLKKLEVLYLDGNHLTDLPEEFGDLKELRELSVSNNQLSAVPTCVQQLNKLRKLFLAGNHLTDLPEWIGDLKELRVLTLTNNLLSAIPTSVKHLKKLEMLFLHGNQLTDFPEWIIGDLKGLPLLDVRNNPFTVDGMRKLLKVKDKKKGKVYIPVYFTDPEEIKAEGLEAQLAYERALKNGSVNVYRGRIFLIGQDRAGKTSLKKSLIGLPFDTNEQSTEGIQVDLSTFEVDVDQVKNWQSIDQNSQRLLGCAKNVARLVVERQCHKGDDENKEREILKMLCEEVDVDSDDDEDYTAAGDEGKESYINQVTDEPNAGAACEQTSAQPELIIDSTSLPDEVTNHANQWIKYIKRKHVKSDINKEDSIVSLDIWDFAGQHLYYASHPVFFSSQAIYVLVYNLSKSLNDTAKPCARQGTRNVILENLSGETNVENLLSWLSTVHGMTKMRGEAVDGEHGKLPYLQPPVLIVGTHADKPFEDIATMESEIRGKIAGKEYEGHVVMPIFSIDNTAGSLQHSWIKKVFWWTQTGH